MLNIIDTYQNTYNYAKIRTISYPRVTRLGILSGMGTRVFTRSETLTGMGRVLTRKRPKTLGYLGYRVKGKRSGTKPWI